MQPNIETLYHVPKLKLLDTEKDNKAIRFRKIINNHYSKEKAEISVTNKKNLDKGKNTDSNFNNYAVGHCDKNRGDQNLETESSKSILRDKFLPRLSNIFRRSNNQIKQIPSIEEKHQRVKETLCEHYPDYRKINTVHQPVYAVQGKVLRTPFIQKKYQDASLQHQYIGTRDQSSCTPSSLTSSLGSIDPTPNLNKRTKICLKRDQEKNFDIFCNQHVCSDLSDLKQNKNLQYPSKYTNTKKEFLLNSSCQANCASVQSDRANIDQSSSSSFWNFIADKLKARNKNNVDDCACEAIPEPELKAKSDINCSPSNCDRLRGEKVTGANRGLPPLQPNELLPNKTLSQNLKPESKPKMKFSKSPTALPPLQKNKVPHECKCSAKHIQNTDTLAQKSNETCQKPHDEVTQSLADKYNGQILCIHNPPCILINGCLNLPPPKQTGLANVWHMTQTEKSSGTRHNLTNQIFEQACQYESPFASQECVPEYQTEKIIQSICNHKPPCEVVHCCYKPKFDPKLKDSCVHVPMCQRLPECLIKVDSIDRQTQCSHRPKCEELPLCSKKLVLTAKQDMSTQVKPRTRMVCRHEPPCLMIPKCIARVICNEVVPYDAIPGCVHKPSCELIPACCRKVTKEMVSISSQYPKTSCRIV
ncbi:unnamed protein product [Leptosia nina]|uniref:Uncharacterized protein n=1 Tax=Leptosia nina TaxID=320188 RepID=A0AAV1J5Z4_9NEOP